MTTIYNRWRAPIRSRISLASTVDRRIDWTTIVYYYTGKWFWFRWGWVRTGVAADPSHPTSPCPAMELLSIPKQTAWD